MQPDHNLLGRRQMLRSGIAFGAVSLWTPGLIAELIQTPRMTEGPFYPDKLPLDTDNDLIVINDALTPAVGEITHLSGRVLDIKGNPIRNAFVEIWQVDNNAVYLHTADDRIRDQRDTNFQGYGRFLTNAKGEYYFRTIKPVAYPGRTPHIHFAVSIHGQRVLTTQLFVKGEPQNQRDGIVRRLSPDARETVLGEFKPLEGSKLGGLEVSFDMILGVTAAEGDDGKMHGIGESEWRRRRG